MSKTLSATELAAMESRFRAMNGQSPSKHISKADLLDIEDRFNAIKRKDAIRIYRATNGKRAKA